MQLLAKGDRVLRIPALLLSAIACVTCFATAAALAETRVVPSEFSTLQAAIDASNPGDTVVLEPGVHFENGIDLIGGITLRSANGDPFSTEIDAGAMQLMRGSDLVGDVIIEGIGFYRGSTDTNGGALALSNSTVEIRGCRFYKNSVTSLAGRGGGIYSAGSTVLIEDSLFEENAATYYQHDWDIGNDGAAMATHSSSIVVRRTTFLANWSNYGYGAIIVGGSSEITFEDTEFFDNNDYFGKPVLLYDSDLSVRRWEFRNNLGAFDIRDGSAAIVEDCVIDGPFGVAVVEASYLEMSACTVLKDTYLYVPLIELANNSSADLRNSILVNVTNHGAAEVVRCSSGSVLTAACCNFVGDTSACTADWIGTAGNISEDPEFCDPEGGVFTIDATSPCAPANSGECGLIGALGVGCGSVGVENLSWGSIKSLYR